MISIPVGHGMFVVSSDGAIDRATIATVEIAAPLNSIGSAIYQTVHHVTSFRTRTQRSGTRTPVRETPPNGRFLVDVQTSRRVSCASTADSSTSTAAARLSTSTSTSATSSTPERRPKAMAWFVACWYRRRVTNTDQPQAVEQAHLTEQNPRCYRHHVGKNSGLASSRRCAIRNPIMDLFGQRNRRAPS